MSYAIKVLIIATLMASCGGKINITQRDKNSSSGDSPKKDEDQNSVEKESPEKDEDQNSVKNEPKPRSCSYIRADIGQNIENFSKNLDNTCTENSNCEIFIDSEVFSCGHALSKSSILTLSKYIENGDAELLKLRTELEDFQRANRIQCEQAPGACASVSSACMNNLCVAIF